MLVLRVREDVVSAIPAPRSRFGLTLVGLLLVDLPVLLAVFVCGFFFGFSHTYETVADWRMAHPWSLLPSLVLAVVLVRRWWRR